MAGLLIVAHSPLASSLKAVVAHVFPNDTGVEAIDVDADATPEQVEKAAREAMARLGESEILVLTDVFGATPCNVTVRTCVGWRFR